MIIYSGILILLLFLLIRYWRKFHLLNVNPWIVPVGFLIKILAGFAFLYVYSFHYGNGELSDDAHVYMHESKIVHDVANESPSDYIKLLLELGDETQLTNKYLSKTEHWDAGEQALLNDAKNLLKVHSLIHFISFGSPVIHVIIMCLIGLIGTLYLTKALAPRSNLPTSYVFLIFLLFPGLLFWSSGLAKEPFVILGIGWVLYAISGNKSFNKSIFYTLLGAFILLMFKSYLLIVAIPGIMFYLGHRLLPQLKLWMVASGTILTITLITLALESPRNKVVHLLTRKQFDFNNIARGGLHVDAGDKFYYFTQKDLNKVKIKNDSVQVIIKTDAMILQHGQMSDPVPVILYPSQEKWPIYFQNDPAQGMIQTTPINNSTLQLIKNIPESLFNVFLRPLPWDPGSRMKYPAILELLIFYTIIFLSLIKPRDLDHKGKVLLIALLFFAISLALLIGWTTPVLGAIARYRIPIVIVGICIFIMKFDFNKIRFRWKNLQ